jgi:hypothetical protein
MLLPVNNAISLSIASNIRIQSRTAMTAATTFGKLVNKPTFAEILGRLLLLSFF